jgi:hypothetical protein
MFPQIDIVEFSAATKKMRFPNLLEIRITSIFARSTPAGDKFGWAGSSGAAGSPGFSPWRKITMRLGAMAVEDTL